MDKIRRVVDRDAHKFQNQGERLPVGSEFLNNMVMGSDFADSRGSYSPERG